MSIIDNLSITMRRHKLVLSKGDYLIIKDDSDNFRFCFTINYFSDISMNDNVINDFYNLGDSSSSVLLDYKVFKTEVCTTQFYGTVYSRTELDFILNETSIYHIMTANQLDNFITYDDLKNYLNRVFNNLYFAEKLSSFIFTLDTKNKTLDDLIVRDFIFKNKDFADFNSRLNNFKNRHNFFIKLKNFFFNR